MDCLEGMKQIEDKSIHMILCDLPYGITNCAWDKIIPMDRLWDTYNRIIKDKGAIVLTATFKFALELVKYNQKNFRYDLVWEKTMPTGYVNAKRMPMRIHENILVFYKKLPTYNPQGLIPIEKPKTMQRKKRAKESIYHEDSLCSPYIQEYKNYPKSILEFRNSNNKSLHPTQKLLDLFKYLILTYTNLGDLVLDNCMGSGTTAIACLETGRSYLGFEKEERYFNVTLNRINMYKNKNGSEDFE